MSESTNGTSPLGFDSEAINNISKDVEENQEELFRKQNVVGVAVGNKVVGGRDTGEPAIKVLVSHKLPESILRSQDLVAREYNDTQTDVEAVGEIFASPVLGTQQPPVSSWPTGARWPTETRVEVRDGNMLTPSEALLTALDPGGLVRGGAARTVQELETDIQLLRTRVRPAEGGYSVGHYRITAGTIATCVYDTAAFPGIPPRFYILSNNHVLANSNNASVGDPILQPGPFDGGSYPNDVIARLSRWVTIRFDGSDNLVDAALAEGPFEWLDREIYWIGYTQGVRNNWPAIGEILQKTGRTTNWTTGRVIAINAIVNVNYGGGQVARFVGQILTENLSAGGDSGSLVLDLNRNAIGLLFAGSSSVTVLNHIFYVQQLLGIRVHHRNA
jgi:hypothetical protein